MEVGDVIVVNDTMQRRYQYVLSAPIGDVHSAGFQPYFTPPRMLEMGVFEGKYCNDCKDEFPVSWFRGAKLSDRADPELTYEVASAANRAQINFCAGDPRLDWSLAAPANRRKTCSSFREARTSVRRQTHAMIFPLFVQ